MLISIPVFTLTEEGQHYSCYLMASFGMADSVVMAARKAMAMVINKALVLIG